MHWRHDEKFKRELKKLAKDYPGIEKCLERDKKLLCVQFDLEKPKQVIAPGKIHRIRQEEVFSVWKLEVVLDGPLRPSQWPRLWFRTEHQVDTITFLAIASHTKNYNDNAMADIALERAEHCLLEEI